MNVVHYIGLDVHRKTISYCIKTAAGQVVKEGIVAAERSVLRGWAATPPQP
jgi:transposase